MKLDFPIIDTNITLGQWPTRRAPHDEPQKLLANLQAHNVTQAWAGHYDALFQTNLTEVNNRLALACTTPRVPLAPPVLSQNQNQDEPANETSPQLVPFGSINPTAPSWEPELDRCTTIHKMPGIRLHPNDHQYKLDDPNFPKLLAAAAERRLIVQLSVLMEDARMMHPLMRVPPVDIGPLEKQVAAVPNLRLVLLGALTTASRTDKLYRLISAGNVYVEISTLETMAALETLINDIPIDRILFGSHAPSFYFEAAQLKLQESSLPAAHIRRITSETARTLLPATNSPAG